MNGDIALTAGVIVGVVVFLAWMGVRAVREIRDRTLYIDDEEGDL